jgi:dicarboxylate/amino acid:cation (Na+ or H+) symporter, DAACS family
MTLAAPETRRVSPALPLQMFGGLVIGLVLALVWPSFAASLQPIGTAFIEAIRMIIIPLIVASVTLGTYKMGRDIRQLGRVAVIAFGWFYFATFCAIVIALVLDGIFHPGVGVDLVPTGKIPPNLAVSIDWVKFLLDLIPSNIVNVMAQQKLLPTLVFSVLLSRSPASASKPARSSTCWKQSWRRCSD